MTLLKDIVLNLSGFKIPATHFRLGSKIHISDFYYAKRFFQNGFFASRMAFLITKYIIDTLDVNTLKNLKTGGLTIIGYEMYSELLISLVSKFLKKKWVGENININHNLYEDFSDLRLCKNNNILQNIIIIVPIASTFSTSIKIENQIYKDMDKSGYPMPNILHPHLNVLFISDSESAAETISKIEQSFSWHSKSPADKTVTVEAIYQEGTNVTRLQKYFLNLKTHWYNIESCPLCHPKNIGTSFDLQSSQNELPLYETDHTAVTPSIIFGFPQGRDIFQADLDRKYEINSNIVSYGHQTRNNSHFLYSINTELFLEKNRVAVQNWLTQIKTNGNFEKTFKKTDRLVIVSTCHYSNVSFITMINEYLFNSAANIIHYDPSNDYVQNFRIVYGQEINDANKIFFVDDSFKSGAAFDKIHQFIQNTLDPQSENKGISTCFFLLNKSQQFTYNNLVAKLVDEKEIYSFSNLHLYTSLKPYETSPLQIEESRYRELVANSFLDSIKAHFQKQADKLLVNVHDLHKKDTNKLNRHLHMLIATHRIYQYFTTVSQPILSSYSDFLADVLDKTKSPQAITGESDHQYQENEQAAYLKVLTQSPFVQYKLLKDKVFQWTLQETSNEIILIKRAIQDNLFTYDLFNRLKFFIRRTGLLNSNFLISTALLEFLPILYSSNGIPKILEELKGQLDITPAKNNEDANTNKLFNEQKPSDSKEKIKEKIFKIKDFHIFYVAQVKELLLKSESRCLKLEENLLTIENVPNNDIKQIVRILREENALIIKIFSDQIATEQSWKKIYVNENEIQKTQPDTETEQFSAKNIDYSNANIEEFLSKKQVLFHHKTQTLNNFFIQTGQPEIIKNKALSSYLWIQYFFEFDNVKKLSLKIKTGLIMKKILELLTHSGINKAGAFLVVNDSRKKIFVAFNQNHDDIKEIDDEELVSKESYISQFLNGESNATKVEKGYQHSKTVIELKRNQQGEWMDLFTTSTQEKTHITLPANLLSSEYDRILLLRISKRKGKNGHDDAQGVLGFYYNEKNSLTKIAHTNVNIIRYLLLLRPSFSKFIIKHHESDEFSDWKIAELKQRTSMLTGHGRDTLISIAQKKTKYKAIVSTLLAVQRFLIDKKEEEMTQIATGNAINITQIFQQFFPPNNKITSDFLKDIETMAKEIFGFEEVENVEDISIIIPPGKIEFSVDFNKQLLKMICFELLVNAKKNRWIFINEIIAPNGEIHNKNKIWIDANFNESGQLEIEIGSTGPAVSHTTLRMINNKKNIKKYDNSSGIELIDTLFSEFDLGELRFSQTPIANELSKFSATITLK